MIQKQENIRFNKNLGRIININNSIQQITINDTRYYKKQDIFYPSVTFILSCYPKNAYFNNWMKRNSEEDINQIVTEASEAGNTVHGAIEDMLINKTQLHWIDESTGYVNYSMEEWLMILRFVEFYNTYKPKHILSEQHIFSNKHIFAGTIDLIVELNGEKWILDIKTSNAIHTVYELQLAAYQECWNELNPDDPIHKSGILWLKARTRKVSSDANKIQGRGWSLITSERSQEENFQIFQKVYDIFRIEQGELKPITELIPTVASLEF